MRTNAQIIRQANNRVLESWGQLAKEVLQRVEVMRRGSATARIELSDASRSDSGASWHSPGSTLYEGSVDSQ